MKIAVAQMVFGLFIVADWGGMMWSMWKIGMWPSMESLLLFYLIVLLGLAVLGCGIAQFVKARRC